RPAEAGQPGDGHDAGDQAGGQHTKLPRPQAEEEASALKRAETVDSRTGHHPPPGLGGGPATAWPASPPSAKRAGPRGSSTVMGSREVVPARARPPPNWPSKKDKPLPPSPPAPAAEAASAMVPSVNPVAPVASVKAL